MGNELAIAADNWLTLTASEQELPVPFAHEIFLQECHVAGILHVDDILIKTEEIRVGSPLQLRREPTNEYDAAAIAVVTAKGDHIGWVPKRHNPVLARLMDAGKLLVAKVASKELNYHWLNLRMGIYLKDI